MSTCTKGMVEQAHDLQLSIMLSSTTGFSKVVSPSIADWDGGVTFSGLEVGALANSVEMSPGADKGARKPGAGERDVELVLLCGDVTESASVSALGLLCHSNNLGRVLRSDSRRAFRRCALE